MTKSKYTPELKARSINMVDEARKDHPSQWATIQSIAQKIGCTPETLRTWYNKNKQTKPAQLLNQEKRIKQLERENKELAQANEILRKATAFFAQAELDRKPK